ncbi:MAG: hypothetical protein ACPHFV_03390 [Poseidonia sp.]
MDEHDDVGDEVMPRLDALQRFGFPRDDMEAFLNEHEAAREERLQWLEQRRDTASEMEDRMVAMAQSTTRSLKALDGFRGAMNNPFTIEETYLQFERAMRELAPWEPPLNRSKTTWYGLGFGDEWALLYRRLLDLDPSSDAAVDALHRLFEVPERYDEVFRHLETVQEDERRQRTMMASIVEDLNRQGYDVGNIEEYTLLDGLEALDAWQSFHSTRERVRLSIKQLIAPFDAGLALDFEQRCNALSHLDMQDDLAALQTEVNQLSQTLEDRRKALSSTIEMWRAQGIQFPHDGDLHPSELMEWEANHDMVEASVADHLAVVERWKRFAQYWPTRVEASKALVGQLEQTAALVDVVDELDALWKKAELDGLDLLQHYEHAGLEVAHWRQLVFEEPLGALERIMARRLLLDRRVVLLRAFNDLDVSFSGQDDVDVRVQLLASEDLDADVLEEMEAFLARATRRLERHRIMLEEELAAMRRAGTLGEERRTEQMSIAELERHVSTMQTGRATPGQGAPLATAPLFLASLEKELDQLVEDGWVVTSWVDQLAQNPVEVARALSNARPFIEHHAALRRRLQRLPWQRDVTLALRVEMELKQPHRLEALTNAIPQWATHLANRPVEDDAFILRVWQPSLQRPTLVPVPEAMERPVLRPTTVLDDAHEAMLEAMEPSLDEDVDGEESIEEVPPIEPVRATVAPVDEEQEDSMDSVEVDIAPEPVQATVDPVEEDVVASASQPVASTTPASTEATNDALRELSTLLALLGLADIAQELETNGIAAVMDVRRGLAQHVNVEPRDVRVARLLRLTLRLLPEGDGDDERRAELLRTLNEMFPSLKRWMRRRLEARHSGASGAFLEDAEALGVALERIPGLGRHVPLTKDTWPLPQDMDGLTNEVNRLHRAVHLASAGGVQA